RPAIVSSWRITVTQFALSGDQTVIFASTEGFYVSRLLFYRGFSSRLHPYVLILAFQATVVDVQVFEFALGLGLKLDRT
ncbi:MAG: hypothetical protein QGH37_34215, partial [Candidatus Poribacteria bacterium]|nr:hypothetical protein [Candidatus Poribacteria bacterium]